MSGVGASIDKRSRGVKVDRISNLPLDLIHKILECLPLREAAKTRVLSQHWRYKWASIPQLILDKSFCKDITKGKNEPAVISSAYSNTVNNILLSRAGPISKFVLYVPSWFPGETYMWIRHVFANDIKEFILEFAPSLRSLSWLRIEETMALDTLDLDIKLPFCWNEILDFFANIKNLTLKGCFWRTFDHFILPEKIPKELAQLRTLNLVEISLYNQFQISFVVLLLTSSPQLKLLSIEAKDNIDGIVHHSIQIDCSYILQCLRKVQLFGLSGLSGELQLLKYILGHSPVLGNMTIEFISAKMRLQTRYDFAVEAMQYRRASPNAEIIIKTK
uniref:F-box domain-containing protein n=1 Tax=Chenopodium quinoa TaxID=63459 RepID=A0A803KVD4_CHEQI